MLSKLARHQMYNFEGIHGSNIKQKHGPPIPGTPKKKKKKMNTHLKSYQRYYTIVSLRGIMPRGEHRIISGGGSRPPKYHHIGGRGGGDVLAPTTPSQCYWVPQKLPQICTVIAYICIGKVCVICSIYVR